MGGNLFEDNGIDGRMIPKWMLLKSMLWVCRLGSAVSG